MARYKAFFIMMPRIDPCYTKVETYSKGDTYHFHIFILKQDLAFRDYQVELSYYLYSNLSP